MERGIIPLVIAGLGNRMFIIAAGYVAHKKTSLPLYIIKQSNNNAHNKHNYDYNKNIFKYFDKHIELSEYDLYSLGYEYYTPGCYNAWFPEHIKPGTIMNSYYQYYPPFEPFEKDLRELFIKGLQEFRNKFTKDYTNCAFLHVRLGDSRQDYKRYQLPIEYYQESVSKLMDKNKVEKIFIISDEMSWVKEQEYFNSDLFELYDTDDELDSLALMTLCLGGSICGGGSTFSWWGAFLGAHSVRNPVFVTKNWNKLDIECLFPKEWTVV